jgi:hypothetical protein
MNADVEKFFDECRNDPHFAKVGGLEQLVETFEQIYQEANESAAFQELWDSVREIVTRREPLIERFKALAPLIQKFVEYTTPIPR